MYEVRSLVKGNTKPDMVCALTHFSLHHALFMILPCIRTKGTVAENVHINMIMALFVATFALLFGSIFA